MTTLNDPQLQVDRDDYPLYFFFGVIPEEDTELVVLGLPVAPAHVANQTASDMGTPSLSKESNTATVYKGLVFRSKDAVLESMKQPSPPPQQQP